MTTEQAIRPHRPLFIFGSIATLAFLAGAVGSSAGIQGSGRFVAARGQITASGSNISVDDVEYSISTALITVDGKQGTASQLAVGQIVTVQGVQEASGTTGTAASVAFTGDVIGPISALDLTGNSLTVLGQTVQVDGTTLFGDGIQPTTLTGLQLGVMIEVSAFEDAAGNLHASRIDLQAAGSPLQVKGTVEALDATAQTFRINDLTVNYSGVQSYGTLANGSIAIVQALAAPAANVLYASQVQLSSGMGGTANETGQLDGLITSMSSSQVFSVGDQQIQTDSSTHFILHGQALAPNLAVRVHGTFTASGVLLADQVKAQPPKAQGPK
jgi:Domain of unknown function (DUF5666)